MEDSELSSSLSVSVRGGRSISFSSAVSSSVSESVASQSSSLSLSLSSPSQFLSQAIDWWLNSARVSCRRAASTAKQGLKP